MSWRDHLAFPSQALSWAAALVSAFGLGGCFHPLYGTSTMGNLQSELQAIAVDPIPERLGHYLANELIFSLNGTGSSVIPKYRLIVTPKERAQTPVTDTISGRAAAATIITDAGFRL